MFQGYMLYFPDTVSENFTENLGSILSDGRTHTTDEVTYGEREDKGDFQVRTKVLNLFPLKQETRQKERPDTN